MYFWTCGLRKTLWDKYLKRSVSEDPLTSNMVNGPKYCSTTALSPFDSSLWRQFKVKKSLWVICKFLGLFVNPLTSNKKYSVLMRGNLFRHFLMQLSQKRKDFSKYYLHFLNLNSILNIIQKKNDPHSLKVFLNLRTPKNVVK